MRRSYLTQLAIVLLLGTASGCQLFNTAKLPPVNAAELGTNSGELNPEQSAEVCQATAEQLARHGREREAILQYERALQFRSPLPGVHWKLAVLYDRQGQYQAAKHHYERALAEEPQNPDLLNDVGYFYYQTGRYESAAESLNAALRERPEHQRAMMNLGLTLAELGRYQESFELFQKVVGEAAAHANVGALLAQHGRTAEAAAALQRARQLEPALPTPPALLAHLETKSTPQTDAEAVAARWPTPHP